MAENVLHFYVLSLPIHFSLEQCWALLVAARIPASQSLVLRIEWEWNAFML